MFRALFITVSLAVATAVPTATTGLTEVESTLKDLGSKCTALDDAVRAVQPGAGFFQMLNIQSDVDAVRNSLDTAWKTLEGSQLDDDECDAFFQQVQSYEGLIVATVDDIAAQKGTLDTYHAFLCSDGRELKVGCDGYLQTAAVVCPKHADQLSDDRVTLDGALQNLLGPNGYNC
ncbi:unnamed protein product [Mycena citricolor]|uniref:Uncharacterized protein n=1 Tax=Mycena citricolor TaxID=2018698 RepID=A0AAD2H7T7_9AGAR|nr:unnamed protein product [Mycena citricolor]